MSAAMLSRNRAEMLGLTAIVLTGLALRLYRLDAQSLWHDEAISVVVSRAPLDQFLGFFTPDAAGLPFEYNPPFYGLLLHAWFGLVGAGGFEARLLSALAGSGCLVLVFLLSRRMYGSATGLLAAALLAVSQIGVMFSQEARNYELFLLLALGTAYSYWIFLTERSRTAWITCTALAVLMLLTQYYGVFVVLALGLHAGLYSRAIPWTWLAGSIIAGAAIVGPWVVFALGGQVSAASDRIQPTYFSIGLSTVVTTINRFNNGAFNGMLDSAPVWSLPAGAALFLMPMLWLWFRALSPARSSQDERRATWLATFLWLVPFAGVVLLGLLANVQFNVRYVAACVAPYYIAVAAGLVRLPRPWLSGAAAAAAIGYSTVALSANYRIPYKEDYRSAIALVSSQSAVGDCFAFVPFGGPPLEWSIYDGPPAERRLKLASETVPADCRRIWSITYHRVSSDAHPRWRAFIEGATAGFEKREDRRFFWVRVERYDRAAAGQRVP